MHTRVHITYTPHTWHGCQHGRELSPTQAKQIIQHWLIMKMRLYWLSCECAVSLRVCVTACVCVWVCLTVCVCFALCPIPTVPDLACLFMYISWGRAQQPHNNYQVPIVAMLGIIMYSPHPLSLPLFTVYPLALQENANQANVPNESKAAA